MTTLIYPVFVDEELVVCWDYNVHFDTEEKDGAHLRCWLSEPEIAELKRRLLAKIWNYE